MSRPLCVLLLGWLAAIVVTGCSDDPSTYSFNWLLGAESQFTARIEGANDDSLQGQADFRTDANGRLVGIELNKKGQPMQGLSLELEPRTPDVRSYSVVDPSLLGVDRPGDGAGFVAYLESEQGSFTATEGTLRINRSSEYHIEGTFDMLMQGTRDSDPSIKVDVTVTGSFQATPPVE